MWCKGPGGAAWLEPSLADGVSRACQSQGPGTLFLREIGCTDELERTRAGIGRLVKHPLTNDNGSCLWRMNGEAAGDREARSPLEMPGL